MPGARVSGQLHDPVSGRVERVELQAAEGRLLAFAEPTPRFLPIAGLRIVRGGWQGTSAELHWEEDGQPFVLTVGDAPALIALGPELAPSLGASLEGLRRELARGSRRARLAIAVLGLALSLPLVGLLLLFLFRAPLSDAVTARIPRSVDARLGDLVEKQVLADARRLRTGAAPAAVERIGSRLVGALPTEASELRFRFHVLDDPQVNAFAAPGGLVVVNTGLLRAVTGPEELAGVLAHEITHATERHSLRQLVFQLGVGALWQVVAGGSEGAVGALGGAALELSGLRFSRDQERAADAGGLALLERARITPDGFVRFFGTLEGTLEKQAGALPAFLTTHPASRERSEALEVEIRRRGPWRVEPLDVDWGQVQAALAAPPSSGA